MLGGVIRAVEYQILEKLRGGPMEVSELKKLVPLYGAAFDFAITHLMVNGLVRVYEKDGKEFAELTELGKSLPYPIAFVGGHHGFKAWHHWWW